MAPRGLEKWQEVGDLSRGTSILSFGKLNFDSFKISTPVENLALLKMTRPAHEWQKIVCGESFQEFEQAQSICESSHGWPRIDRIFTDMHKADHHIGSPATFV